MSDDKKVVKRFKYEEGNFYGPAEYMEERGHELLDDIFERKDEAFEIDFLPQAPDRETAVLVRLQTDYAEWRGMKEMERRYG